MFKSVLNQPDVHLLQDCVLRIYVTYIIIYSTDYENTIQLPVPFNNRPPTELLIIGDKNVTYVQQSVKQDVVCNNKLPDKLHEIT
jgi:hypothetical protein